MPRVIIHRGSRTIGGSCIEIQSGGHRILIDLGSPLMLPGGGKLNEEYLEHPSVENGVLPDVQGLYKDSVPEVSAVLISHAHLDHCGLINHIHDDIPVCVSKGSNELIQIGKVFYPDKSKIVFENFHIFDHWKPFQIGPFRITSHLVDHSGYDASSFLVEADGKRIFYSGDFRGHGRKSILLDKIIEKPIPNIDCLLMEGTTLGGKHHAGYETEDEVENALLKIFSEQSDVSFITASGSNIDRLVSLYKATRKAKKVLVLDLYTFYLLHRLKKINPEICLPPFEGDNVRIYYIKGHAQSIVDHLGKKILYQFSNRKIEIKEMLRSRRQMVAKLPLGAMKKITKAMTKESPTDGAILIYSMWQGYLEKDTQYRKFCRDHGLSPLNIHVSGHAYLNDLKRLAGALKPKKLVPVHTLVKDEFSRHFKNVETHEDFIPFEV